MKKPSLTRREFIGKGAAGAAALGFSPALIEVLLTSTGCKSGADAGALIVAEDVLRKSVSLLMAKGADFADVYAERAAIGGAGSDDRKINTTTVIEKGVGFRAVKDGKTFYAYTASFLPADLFAMADVVASAAAQGAAKAGAGAVIRLAPSASALKFPITPLPSDTPADKKIELVRSMTDRAWSADPRVVQVIQLLRETLRQVNIATSEGKLIDQTLGLTEFISYIFMKDPKSTLQSAIDARGAYAGLSFFTAGNSLETIVDTSVARTKKLLEAVDSPRGVFPVVLGPGAPAVIFHESCGHGMEADLVFKGSNFKDQLGKPTASRGVTLVDDGTIPSFPGSYAFDDEGTPSERTVLIEDGVQKNYLCDRIWAAKLGLRSTGSGRRQSFRYPPIPRMRNTYIEKGTVAPDDIVRDTKRGIYVTAVAGGGQVDVITGNFMMGVGEAQLIENGQLTRPIKNATLSGMGIEALKSIDAVGTDLGMDASAGRCGKGQAAPVGFGMPTVRVRSILVGGQGEAWDEKGGAK
jgi:TldD protein